MGKENRSHRKRSRSRSWSPERRKRTSRSNDRSYRSRSRDRKMPSRSIAKRSRSRERISNSTERRSKSREKRSRSKERRSRSRDKRSRSKERTKRSRSRDKRSRSADKYSRSRDRRSKSKERRKRSRSKDRRSKSRDRRSRSREHRRSRSRDRRNRKEKKRSNSKERRRDKKKRRSRSSSTNRNKRSHTPDGSHVVHREGAISVRDEPLDKEEEQKRLELEMQKRRERIEQWRLDRKKGKQLTPINIAPVSKKWSLEDDDEDEDEVESKDKEEDDEMDPLDAYMNDVSDEVKKLKDPDSKTTDVKMENGAGDYTMKNSKVTVITGVVKKSHDPTLAKGERMENNADAIEYSSEEEEEDLETTMSNMAKRKKENFVVNHDKIYYATFRKDFYVEVPEIASMTNGETDELRAELEGIKAKGKNCPKPIKSWAQCGVSRKIMDVFKKQNFEKPTPIQAQAIPVVMSGRDMIGIAKTGSGKTLAFLVPMFRHILDQEPIDEGDGPIAIVLTPTRELAMQIYSDAKKFTKSLGLHVVAVYGGTGISEQITELKRGCEIVVCTPGRMIDMIAANNGKVTNCRRCTYVVLDEADRMFDMGFEPQVMKIMDSIRPDRQTVMFSATFPRQMEALARRILQKPIEVQVGGRSVVCKDVTQYAIVIEEENKFLKLLELLGIYQEEGSVLVFVDKQENADDLMKDLLKRTYPCLSLHGGQDQYDRDSTIVDFKKGDVRLLIATSVAARGLDVKHLILVINYNCPNHYEDYVHRCGRTGRAGNRGTAYTFITPEQGGYAGDIIKAMELSGTAVPADLSELWESHKAKLIAEGKKVKGFSGFRGKGFKFDETEAELANDRKKFQKAALGLQDSDDEDVVQDIEQQIEDMFASRKRVTDVSKTSTAPSQPAPVGGTVGFAQKKLELAKQLAAKINIQKNLGAEAQDISQQAAKAIMTGEMAAPQVASKTIAEQMAEKINAKLGYMPKADDEGAEEDDTFKRYEEELEINDFPQTARWKVTSKEALAQISEYSEAGITVRGTYVLPGKQPEEGERKLYLAIEATSEMAIQKAKKDITRLIKEELIRLQNSYQPINKSRYKVL